MTNIRPIPNGSWDDDPVVEAEDFSADEEVPESAMRPLLGGGGATMSAAPEESIWSVAGQKLKEAIFGHPDRAEAKAAGIGQHPTTWDMLRTGAAGGVAMLGGSTAGGIAAQPLRAGLRAAAGYYGGRGGQKAGEKAGRFAEEMGAPAGTAEVGEMVGGMVGGVAGAVRSPAVAERVLGQGRRLLSSVRGRAAADVAEEAASAAPLQSEVAERTLRQSGRTGIPEQGPRSWLPAEAAPARGGNVAQFPAPAAPSAAQAQADEIKDFILRGRTKHGLSGAQIVDGLRQIHGIPPSAGQKMVSDVLESLKGAK